MQKRQPNFYKLIDKSPAYIKRLRNKNMHKYLRLKSALITLYQFNITDRTNPIFNVLKDEINFYYDMYVKLNGIYMHITWIKNNPNDIMNKLDEEYITKILSINTKY